MVQRQSFDDHLINFIDILTLVINLQPKAGQVNGQGDSSRSNTQFYSVYRTN